MDLFAVRFVSSCFCSLIIQLLEKSRIRTSFGTTNHAAPSSPLELDHKRCKSPCSSMKLTLYHERETHRHQLFYLGLLTAGVLVFFRQGWPFLVRGSPYLSPLHTVTAPLAILITYFSFFLASAADPGRLNSQNAHGFTRLHPYDNVIFPPKNCETCKIPRFFSFL